MIAWMLAAALAAEKADPAPVTPYYETRSLILGWYGDTSTMRPRLGEELRKRRLEVWRQLPDGQLEPSNALLSGLSIDAVAAGLVVVDYDAVGAELDTMIGVSKGDELRPVTVRWDTGRLIFAEGEPTDVVLVPGPDPHDLVGRFGFAALQAEPGRSWDGVASGLLLESLEKLSAAELEVLGHVHFRRVASNSCTGDRALAGYESEDGVARIELYDLALQPTPRFIGEPGGARPWVFYVLLHEIGHAIAFSYEYERREALEAVKVAAIEAANHGDKVRGQALLQASDRLEALAMNTTPPAAALRQTLVNGAPATWYGRTGPDESFADAFALYHADRAALERAAPEAVAFFDRGDHLAALAETMAAIDAVVAEVRLPASP